MWFPFLSDQTATISRVKWVQQRPELLGLCFSILCLCAYFVGGEVWLLSLLALGPVLGLFAWRRANERLSRRHPPDSLTGLRPPEVIQTIGQKWLSDASEKKKKFACFAIGIDGFDDLAKKHGDTAAQQIQRSIAARLLRGLRQEDMLTRTAHGQFMFILTPVRHLDLEICIQLASRLKSAVEVAMPIDATSVRMSASMGFCRNDQLKSQTFDDLAEAAQLALAEAQRAGGSIRSYSADLKKRERSRNKLATQAAHALQLDQIEAWFQPQVSNETGAITGFETLARWRHPNRGILTPAEFMETLTNTGQLERLAEVMLKSALEAQLAWEQAGYQIPHVGVNFAGEELRNPMLVEKIHWELDRFDLAPNRIAIEVLETVIADAADGAISRNVNGLANLGCYIDLDDFGTGHASISSIRRFAVSRLKIDRSFVMKVDQDPEQQKLVAAIVTMAERLGMETLAEGVETPGEHAMLAQLGCGHVQGFGIARPMPFEQTIPWMKEYLTAQKVTPMLKARNL